MAMHSVLDAIREDPRASVPLHIRNAPTKLMKSLNYGEGYDYPHNHDEGYAVGVQYLPDKLKGRVFYEPSERGYEKNIRERMDILHRRAPKNS
jgi:putative ATPase